MNTAHVFALFFGLVMISSASVSSVDAFLPADLPAVSKAYENVKVIHGPTMTAFAKALYTSPDNPSNHQIPSSDPHNGVAELILTRDDGTFGCSGTLANDRQHIITAAHCVADDNGVFILNSGWATFDGNSESISIALDAVN